jgi:hypothetical protein
MILRTKRFGMIHASQREVDGIRQVGTLIRQGRTSFAAESASDVHGRGVRSRLTLSKRELIRINSRPCDKRSAAGPPASVAMAVRDTIRLSDCPIADCAAETTSFNSFHGHLLTGVFSRAEFRDHCGSGCRGDHSRSSGTLSAGLIPC